MLRTYQLSEIERRNYRISILNMHVQNKKYENLVFIARLTGEYATQKKLRSSSLWTCLHHMVILRSQNKNTDFLMILA